MAPVASAVGRTGGRALVAALWVLTAMGAAVFGWTLKGRLTATADMPRVEQYVGSWYPVAPDEPDPSAVVRLSAAGDRVSGSAEPTGAKFDLRWQDGILVGECVEADRTTPVRVAITQDRSAIVIALLPRASEPDYTLCVRASGVVAPSPVSKAGPITPEEAIGIVRDLPAVRGLFESLPAGGDGRLRIEIAGKEGDVYTVHVYELVPGGSGSPERVSRGWYEVDKKTGEVTSFGI